MDTRAIKAVDRVFLAAVFFAIAVGPFIGGIRGVPLYVLWYGFPLLWVVMNKAPWSDLGIRLPDIRMLALSIICGCAMAGLLYGIHRLGNGTFRFVNVIPALHRDFTKGNYALFLAAIPVAHIAHELFFRGLIQNRFAVMCGSHALGLMTGALMFAWTHAVIFSSPEYLGAYASAYGQVDGHALLWPVFLFTALESLGAGGLLALSGSVVCSVVFRVVNLLVVIYLLAP